MNTTTHSRKRSESTPPQTQGQRWGLAVVVALPAILVALAIPLIIEGSLVGFVYAPLVIGVMVATTAMGHWVGLGIALLGVLAGSLIGPGGSCLLYTSPSPRDLSTSRMPSSA